MLKPAVVVLLCAVYTSSVQAISGAGCKSNEECDPGECCYQINKNIYSKRILPIEPVYECRPYQMEGEACSGSCGCHPDLVCKLDMKVSRDAPADLARPVPGTCRKPPSTKA